MTSRSFSPILVSLAPRGRGDHKRKKSSYFLKRLKFIAFTSVDLVFSIVLDFATEFRSSKC